MYHCESQPRSGSISRQKNTGGCESGSGALLGVSSVVDGFGFCRLEATAALVTRLLVFAGIVDVGSCCKFGLQLSIGSEAYWRHGLCVWRLSMCLYVGLLYAGESGRYFSMELKLEPRLVSRSPGVMNTGESSRVVSYGVVAMVDSGFPATKVECRLPKKARLCQGCLKSPTVVAVQGKAQALISPSPSRPPTRRARLT